MEKKAIVVLGMHRSGTSLLAKALETLGFDFTGNLMPANRDNPTGFWEDIDIVRLNDSILRSNQSSWEVPLDSDTRSFSPEFDEIARKILLEKFSNRQSLIIKDPRISILLGFWSKQFSACNISADYLVSYRDPINVSASLNKRDGIDTRMGLLLNYFYNRSIMEFLGGDAFLVNYLSLIREAPDVLQRLATHLGLAVDEASISRFCSEFVDPKLNHHEHQTGSLKNYPGIAREVADLSVLMKKLSEGKAVDFVGFSRKYPAPRLKSQQNLFELQLRREVPKYRRLAGEFEKLSLAKGNHQSEIASLQKIVRDRENHIGVLQKNVDGLISDISRANQVLKIRDKEIDNQKDILDQQKDILDQQKDILDQKEGKIRRSEEVIQELNEASKKAREDHEKQRTESDRAYNEVIHSISFRLGRMFTYPIRKPFASLILPRLESRPLLHSLVRFFRACLANPIQLRNLFSFRRLVNFFSLLLNRDYHAEAAFRRYEAMLQNKSPGVSLPSKKFTDMNELSAEIKFSLSSSPRVSVLIPVFNQIRYTLECLRSIAENLPDVAFEVLVIDDCSTDNTLDLLKRIEGLTVLSNESNLGFLKSCNSAVSSCRGEFIFLLNNDTRVTAGWLDSMIDIFENYDDAGVVGSKLVYPDGSLQEAGGIIWRDGSGWNYGRNENPDLPEFNYVKRVDYVSGASILFRREWFSSVGRFDERFAPAYYEDTDLAFQARLSGLQVYYQPKSVIVHYEGKSHGVKENEGIKKTQWINQKKFREKWSEVLDSQHQENGKAVIRARERSQSRITVLVIDHYVPLYDQDAGSRSTFQYLELLVKAGCNVKFMGDNFYRHQPYSGQLEGMGIEVLVGDFYRKHWKRWLEENPDYVDIVYLMRPHVAEKYIDDINSLTRKPKVIYFGHDLHFLRLQRKFVLTKNKTAEKEARIWKLKEYAIFDKADVVYFPSIAEVEEILKDRPSLPVKAIPLFCYDEWGPGNVDFNQREGLLFVGGFNHPPNIDGLKWFLQEIFPLVLEKLPYIVLHIVGSNMPTEIRKLGSANVRIEGFLSDEELCQLYDRVRLSVVPLRYGAGVKGKVLEAMKHGVPVITTSIGAEGIPDPSGSLLTEDDPFKLGGKIADIYEDHSLLKAHSIGGLKVIEENFSQRVVLEKIEDDFLIGGRSGK